MDIQTELRFLVSCKHKYNLNYEKWYGFKTVFYESSYSYICCPCGFQHEFLDYIENNGNIDENIFAKIVRSIETGRCPHTDCVPNAWVRDTGLTALLIAAGVGAEPTPFTKMFEKRTLKSGYIQAGIFKQNMYEIAFNKRNFKNCCYYFQRYFNDYVLHYPILIGSFPGTIPTLYKPIKTAEIYQIVHEPCLEAFVKSGNKMLLETALGLTGKFGEIIQIRYCRESETFHYMMKHNLIEFVEMFVEYVKRIDDPSLAEYCMRYASMYNLSNTMKNILAEKLPKIKLDDSGLDVISILKKQNKCLKKLRREAIEHNQLEQESDNNNDFAATGEDFSEMVELLEEFHEDFRTDIIDAMKQIPNVKRKCVEYIDKHLTDISKKPHILKEILDLRVGMDDCTNAVEHMILARIIDNLNLYTSCVRDTVELLVTTRKYLEHLKVFSHGLRQDVCTYRMRPRKTVSGIYRADLKEHGLFVREKDDFALNFAVPFLLHCGIPATKDVLEDALKADLHPAEHAYIEQYLKNKNQTHASCNGNFATNLYSNRYTDTEEYIDKPKPLQIICREVIHAYHKGAVAFYLEQSSCPEPIKDFVLLRNLQHCGSDAHMEAHKRERGCQYCTSIPHNSKGNLKSSKKVTKASEKCVTC